MVRKRQMYVLVCRLQFRTEMFSEGMPGGECRRLCPWPPERADRDGR
jgi:hypothetical protein